MTPTGSIAPPAPAAPAASPAAAGAVTFPLDHAGGGVLSSAACLRLVAIARVGRVAFRADGEIVVLPVNHIRTGDTVAFRSAVGSKLSAALDQDVVAFEVDGYDSGSRSGWSVLINGRAEVVTEERTLRELERTGLAPWSDRVEHPHWVRISPDAISGRIVTHT